MDIMTIVQIGVGLIFLYLVYDAFKPVKNFQQLTEDEVKNKIKASKNVVLVDVRNPYEFKTNHLKGAINLPLPKIRGKKVEIPTDKEVILYCQTGIRSKQAAKILRKRNKEMPLAHLKGGLYSWKGATSTTNRKK
ncbi:rhodanese-like domain-containing protein [Fredinandcohnia humi]